MQRLLLTVILVVCCAAAALSAEPSIRNLDVRGLQIGAVTTVTIDGTDLEPNPRLMLPFPASIELKPGATAAKCAFEVKLDDGITPGICNLRLATDEGVTSPVVVGVDRLPQIALPPQVTAFPAALHGTVGGSNVVETRFTGQAGQEVIIDVEAQRLGSKLRPVVHLVDARRVQLAWSWPTPSLYGDARLSVKLPADGAYQIQLHDAEYAAGNPSYFRIKIGVSQPAEQVFPPAVARGKTASVELLGLAAKVDVTPSSDAAWMPVPWPDPQQASGLRPRVQLSDRPELVEPAADLPASPVGVSGRLSHPGEEDRFKVAVTPGVKLRLEVFAERYGSSMDAVIVVRNEQGQQLARGEDGPGTLDTLLEYTVPDKMESLVLSISDLHGRGGPRCIYRLTVDSAAAPEAGFSLRLAADRLQVARHGRTVAPLFVQRRECAGPIRLALDQLPAGVSCISTEIPEQTDGVLLTLEAGEGGVEQLLTALRATSAGGKLARLATVDHPLASLQPWLAEEIACCSIPATGFTADWGELASDASLYLGGRLPMPIKVVRPEGQTGPVRLALLTSQDPPRVNNNPDPNKSLRAEAAVELAADKGDGELKLVIPVDLPSKSYDLALRAELLSADKQKVLKTAFTAVRRLPIVNPLGLALAAPRFEATLDPKAGATVKLTGKIERKGDLKADVTVTASGLPGGIRAAPVVVKGEATDFEVPIMFPANFKPGEVTGIKLVATAAPNPQQAQQLVRTGEIEVPLTLLAPEKTDQP